MKLSKQTIEILRWASTINDSILIEPGNRIRTISMNKGSLLEATVPETFPSERGVAQLSRVLDHINEGTELSFDNPTHLDVFNGRRTTKVPNIDRKLILSPPSKSINIKDYEESIFLHSDDVYEIRRLKSEKTVVEFHADARDERIQMDSFIVDEPISQTLQLVRTSYASQRFRARIKVANLKLWIGAYQVEIASAGVARFTWLNGNAVVFVALETAHSNFDSAAPRSTRDRLQPERQADSRTMPPPVFRNAAESG